MYNKYVKSDEALFQHLHGSSWHGDDAKSVLWILHHPIFLAVLTLTGKPKLVAILVRRLFMLCTGSIISIYMYSLFSDLL